MPGPAIPVSHDHCKEVRLRVAGGLFLFLTLSLGGSAWGQDVPRFGLPPLAHTYHRPGGVQSLAMRWDEVCGESLRWYELAADESSAPLVVFEFGRTADGLRPLEERPTVFLLGGADGISLVGSESVLHIARDLLCALEELNPDLCVIAVPFAAPEALERCLEGGPGATQEGACDLDGDGLILEMLREAPGGLWTRSSDARFLVPARPGDYPRYERRVEGAQGRPGLTGLEGHFPVGWEARPGAEPPLADPRHRALASLMLERRTALVLSFAGSHGGVRRPEAAGAQESSCHADLAHAFAVAMRGNDVRCEAPELAGSLLDWVETVIEAPALELSVWGPPEARAMENTLGDDPWRRLPEPLAADLAWGRWVDEDRAGIGFVEWRRVELGRGERALVGGWAPRTRFNPPEEHLERVLEPVPAFVRSVLAQLPSMEVGIVEQERDGDMVHLRVRVTATGELPLAFGESRPWIRLDVPVGVECVAGAQERELRGLHAGGGGMLLEWQLLAPEGATLSVSCGGPFSATRTREVRP